MHRRFLVWFNLGLGSVSLVPCCFFAHFPFLIDAVQRSMRWRFGGLPDGSVLTPLDMFGVPFALMYVAQLLFVGIPAFVAAAQLRSDGPRGLWLALGVLVSQWTFLVANVTCVFCDGPFAFRSIGLLAALIVLFIEVLLLAVHAALLCLAWRRAI